MTQRTIHTEIELNDGRTVPQLGFGTFQIKDRDTCISSVHTALEAGIRHFDTATLYGNEEHIGEAFARSDVDRQELFVTTKCWMDDFGTDATRSALETSLRKLDMEYVDLYLLHWPQDEKMMEAWQTMLAMQEEGKIRSVGVSNFTVRRFTDFFFKHTDVVPAANQIEQHPRRSQMDVQTFCHEKGIAVESYSPLGQAKILQEDSLVQLAEEVGKSPAQVVLRWHLQHDRIVIPKSSHPERIRENADLFDFELTEQQMKQIDGLDAGESVISFRPDGWY